MEYDTFHHAPEKFHYPLYLLGITPEDYKFDDHSESPSFDGYSDEETELPKDFHLELTGLSSYSKGKNVDKEQEIIEEKKEEIQIPEPKTRDEMNEDERRERRKREEEEDKERRLFAEQLKREQEEELAEREEEQERLEKEREEEQERLEKEEQQEGDNIEEEVPKLSTVS